MKIFVGGHLLFTEAEFRQLEFRQVITSTDAMYLMPLNEVLTFTRYSGKCTWISKSSPAATLTFEWFVDAVAERMRVLEQSIVGNFLFVDRDVRPYSRYRMGRMLSLWVAMHFDPRKAETDLVPVDPATVDLTKGEIDILKWASKGKTAWEIARIVGESERTIKFRRDRLIRKLGAVNMVQAAVMACGMGIIA